MGLSTFVIKSPPGYLDISDMDKVWAILTECGHRVRVHRSMVDGSKPDARQTCARCWSEGRDVRSPLRPDGDLPPARAGYAPPRRLGFSSGASIEAFRDAPPPARVVDIRSNIEKDAAKESAARDAARITAQARERAIEASYRLMRELADELGHAPSIARYDQAVQAGLQYRARRLVEVTGKRWSDIQDELGLVADPRRGGPRRGSRREARSADRARAEAA